MNHKILCVDDDANVLAGYVRALRKQFSLDIALGPEQALALFQSQGPFAVVVADMRMPGMNGIELLRKIEEKCPETIRVMLTGNADQATAVEAVNRGHVFRFLTKPCSSDTLGHTLEEALHQYRLAAAERELLENTLNGAVKVLMEILAICDPVAFGRAQKLRESVRVFVQHFKSGAMWELELAAMLSHIGLVALPPQLVEKVRSGRSLTPREEDAWLRIPETGATLLSHIPRLERVVRIVLYQNKNYDGSGFPPDSVAGDEIPIGSRVLRVLADMLQLESQGVDKGKALQLLQARPNCYDPRVLEAAAVCFEVPVPVPAPSKRRRVSLAVKDLRPGQVLFGDVVTTDGLLIVSAGTRINPLLLAKLRNFASLIGIREPILVEE